MTDLRKQAPRPFDFYPAWSETRTGDSPLTPFEESVILSALPPGAGVKAVCPAKSWAFFPLRITAVLPGDEEQTIYFKKEALIGGGEREARILLALSKLGLTVPTLQAGPVLDTERPGTGSVLVLRELPGENVLSWCWEGNGEILGAASRLVLEGVEKLHGLTEAMSEEDAGRDLPRRTLRQELQGILDRSGPWMEEAVFSDAAKRLAPRLDRIETPLVFSNGDYNPANFLHRDGEISGYLDFAWSCFEDPLYGFTKYWTYDWYPLNHAGLVEKYLYRHGLTRKEFAPRLALRCLWTLQRETSVEGSDEASYRDTLLRLLHEAMDSLER